MDTQIDANIISLIGEMDDVPCEHFDAILEMLAIEAQIRADSGGTITTVPQIRKAIEGCSRRRVCRDV